MQKALRTRFQSNVRFYKIYSQMIDQSRNGNCRGAEILTVSTIPQNRSFKGQRCPGFNGTSVDPERDRAQRRGLRVPLISHNCHAFPRACVHRSDIARPDTRNTPFCTPVVGPVTRAMLDDSYRFNG